MAKDLNKVQMTGRLGADPEMRYTPQGHTIATFRVASNRSWRTPQGEPREETEWFRVVAWNKLAEVCGKWLIKGARVYVEGRLQTRYWQDQDGQNRSLTEVIASDLIVLNRRDPMTTSEAEDIPDLEFSAETINSPTIVPNPPQKDATQSSESQQALRPRQDSYDKQPSGEENIST